MRELFLLLKVSEFTKVVEIKIPTKCLYRTTQCPAFKRNKLMKYEEKKRTKDTKRKKNQVKEIKKIWSMEYNGLLFRFMRFAK